MSAIQPHRRPLTVQLPRVGWSALPKTRRPWLVGELLIGGALFAAYLLVDSLGGAARTAAARSHATGVIRLEQWLHLDVEASLNHWLASQPGLMTAANYEYATTYLVSASLLLVITYLWTPRLYRQARNSFVLLNLIAFGCFALLPLMPPRMMPGFIDTVATGGTVGSWGSPIVAGANQLAAMPSLHMAWALWVSVMLARMSRARWLQVLSAVHVAVTLYVVLATANHYVLDVLGAAVVVGVGVAATEWWDRRQPGDRMPTSDAFFLDVESPGHAQNVGGLTLLAGSPSYEQVRDTIAEQLDVLPHFTDRLAGEDALRWVPAGPIDWSHHLVELTLPDGSGQAELDELAAALTAEPLLRDRPLWRAWLIRGVGDRVSFVIEMHHCMADGIGAVAKLLHILQPTFELPVPDREGPTAVQRGLGVIQGLAQLATDGRRSTPPGGTRRGLATIELPLDSVREVARTHELRVTELLLAAAGTALAHVEPSLARASGDRLRASVPIMLRAPGPESGDGGNLTGAVIVDVAARDLPIDRVRDDVRRFAAPLRTPTRALASRWVMASALRAVPHAGRRWFARTVYGPKYFQAIVSNMPGPDQAFTLAGVPMVRVHPILPPAPGIPLTIGALSWGGTLGITVITDADVLDARAYAESLRDRLTDPPQSGGAPQTSARKSCAR